MTTTPSAVAATLDGEHGELQEGSDLVLLGGAQLLLAAARIASSDEGKGAITAVQLRKQEHWLELRATNGHIAMRCNLPLGGPVQWSMSTDELRLEAKTLKKVCAKARHAIVKGDRLELLDDKAKPCDLRAISYSSHTYPGIDAIWPNSFSYMPKRSIALAANYMELLSKLSSQLSAKGNLKLRFSTPEQPCELAIETDDGLQIEFLIMPVIIRNEVRTDRDYAHVEASDSDS